MQLRPIAGEDIPRVAAWFADPANHKWLDFGRGVRRVDEVALKIMVQRDLHLLRLFTPDDDDRPVGVVALSDIDREFGTATLWALRGEKVHGVRPELTTDAVSRILAIGFRELGLAVVNAWTVESNRPARRILERLNFHFIGRQRQCHVLDGRRYDRLWYDLLAEEHEER